MRNYKISISCLLVTIVILSGSLQANGADYWQQYVEYDIRVTLNDSAHTLSAYEKLTYTNNSPDTLEFIWFHLWPNAYKNDETAFAKQKIKYYSTRFHFSDDDDRGYIDSLDFSVNGQSLRWEFHPDWIDVAKVYLPEPLLPGATVTIETPFFVKIPVVFSRLGHTGKHYEITQWYPKPAVYDSEGWHPMPYLDMGEFYSEFGSYDVYITLPENYRIMATGDLVNGDKEYAWLDSLAEEGKALHILDKKAFKKKIKEMKKNRKKKENRKQKTEKGKLKTVHFHQEKVHDFAWFADPTWIIRKGELWLADSTRKVTLWSMYLPKNAKLWEKSIEYLHDSGYWYGKFYGDYPYNHITAVDGDMSAGGGMEYPNITVISKMPSKDMLEYVIMHEVGHNWFYGILGSNERDHAFLDEGLNEYTNFRYWEKKYPERNGRIIIQDFIQNKLRITKNLDIQWVMGYLGYQTQALKADDQPIDIPSVDFSQNNYGSIIYWKTAIFMRFLQSYLGEEKMNEVMQDYYETWKFKHPSPDDFKSFFDKYVEEDLSWYFDDVINDTKVIDYAVSSLSKESVVINNLGSMAPPIELVFYDKSESELGRQWISGFEGRQSVNIPVRTKKVVIDPGNQMPDINRDNNSTSKPIKFNFVFDQPTFHNFEINWLPWIGGNVYNGITPGFSAYSGYFPGSRYGISAVPQWDFENNELVGSISAQRKFFKSLGFRVLTVSTRVANYSGRKGGRIAFSGTIRKPIVSTPSVKVKGTVYYHDINSDAVNSTFYTSGVYNIQRTSVEYRNKVSPFFRYSVIVGMLSGKGHSTFAQVNATGKLYWKFAKEFSISTRTWIGSFLKGDNIPNQYQIWMSGGVNPDFENSYVFNRTDDNGNPGASIVNVYDEQFIQDGPSLRGAVPVASVQTAWGINMDQSLPLGPIALFADIAGATDLQETYLDFGLTFSMGSIKFYLPLYLSWDEENKTPSDFQWFKSRARFEFNIPFLQVNR